MYKEVNDTWIAELDQAAQLGSKIKQEFVRESIDEVASDTQIEAKGAPDW